MDIFDSKSVFGWDWKDGHSFRIEIGTSVDTSLFFSQKLRLNFGFELHLMLDIWIDWVYLALDWWGSQLFGLVWIGIGLASLFQDLDWFGWLDFG